MIRFDHPELLLLALPAIVVVLRVSPKVAAVRALRVLVVLLLVAVLAGPRLDQRGLGNDVIVVLDRSRSMPTESAALSQETIKLLEGAMGRGDRLGIVTFGARPHIEQSPVETSRFGGMFEDIDREGSDLGGALEHALALAPEGRAATLLLLSDGENRGRDAVAAANRAKARGIPIFVRPILRSSVSDVAVERLDLPGRVNADEPFQFTAWVTSDSMLRVQFELQRDGITIASGERDLEAGRNRLVFRDRVARESIPRYRLVLNAPGEGDRIAENSTAIGAVRVAGTPRILVLNGDGSRSRLVTALEGGGLAVDAKTPEIADLSMLSLGQYRAVILENVSAARVGRGMDALAEFVSTRGGGLVMTGGRASFGVGGYHRSSLDPVLPVSMELRQEMRKMAIAVAFALDRSGSMAAPAGAGRTKMDLANAGTVAAIEMLSPMDSVAVIAVDSAAHTIVEMQSADSQNDIAEDVLRIQSMGGGIFTRTALEAAADQVLEAPQANRHIVLFADAADAEEHEGCLELIAELRPVGVTLSVIALGSKTDSDGKFLEEIAAAGGGEAHFVSDVDDLPRVFSHDIMTVARSSYIEGDIGTAVLPDLLGLGSAATSNFPTVTGYNLTYLRPKALAGVATTDEWKAPLVAFQYHGIGRSAAVTTPIGGSFIEWPGFADFAVTLGRFAIGQEAPDAYFGAVRRVGGEAVISVEVDRELDPTATPPREVQFRSPSGETQSIVLERVGEDRVEARIPLSADGVALGAIDVGDHRVLALPPVALPYSPEFEPSPDPRRGERLLARLAAETGGGVLTTVDPLFELEGLGLEAQPIGRPLALLALFIFLLELIERRFSLCANAARTLLVRLRRFRPVPTPASATSTGTATLDSRAPSSSPTFPTHSRDPDAPVHELRTAAPPPPQTPAAPPPAAPKHLDAAALAREVKNKRRK